MLLKIVCHHIGAHYLALSHDVLLLKACKQVLGERTQIVEFRSKEFLGTLLVFVCGVEFLHMSHIFSFEIVDYIISSIRILLVEIV